MNAQQLNHAIKKHFSERSYKLKVEVTAICMDHDLLVTVRGSFNECIAARMSLMTGIIPGFDTPLQVSDFGEHSFFLIGFDNPKN